MTANPSPLRLSLITWKRLWAELFWVYDDVVHPQGRNSTSKVTWSTAWLMREGKVTVRNENGSVTGKKGQWVFPPAGRRHQMFSKNARILSVSFHASWPAQHEFFGNTSTLLVDAASAPELETFALRILEVLPQPPPNTLQLMRQAVDFGGYMTIMRRFHDWLEAYVSVASSAGLRLHPASASDDRIQRAACLIDSYSFRHGFTEEEVATQVGLSIRQLSRLFQEHLGTSPARYFDRKRLNHACDLLIDASTPIKEISYELGFSSPAYFSNWFKGRTGISPRTFREQNGHPAT